METHYSLDDMRLFWVVAQQGSFSKAAQSLGMPISTLSRRIKQLEQSLKLRLLHRDAHKITLTSTGSLYLQQCGPLLEQLQHIGSALSDEKRAASGKIRISAPNNLTQHKLAHIFNEFLRRYPSITIELSLSNKNIDLENEQIDIAFRVSEDAPQEWIVRPLEQFESIICAPPNMANIYDVKHPQQLEKIPIIISNPVKTWYLIHKNTGEKFCYTPNKEVRLEADDLNVVSQSVIEGLGIGFLPRFMADTWISKGILVQIMPTWSGQARNLNMLYHDRENMPHRLRLFIDFVLKHHHVKSFMCELD